MAGPTLPLWAQRRQRRRRRRLALRAALSVVALTLAAFAPSLTGAPGRAGVVPLSDSAPRIRRGGDAWGGVATAPGTAPAFSIGPAPVTHVRDGDTIVIGDTALRLAGLDCAELGTPQGERARVRMQALVRVLPVTCTLTGEQSHDRQIADCRLSGGADLGEVMIAEGLCTHYVR